MNETSDRPRQPVVVTWPVLAASSAAMAVLLVILALAVPTVPARIAFGTLAAIFAAGALSNYRRRYELADGELVVVRAFSRQALVLSQLTSAAVVRVYAGRGRTRWQLILEDRQGTKLRLSFAQAAPTARRRFLTTLAPYVAAPDVRVSGPMVQALADQIW